jgi:phenylalanyl-tRNA synthetase alpha chain
MPKAPPTSVSSPSQPPASLEGCTQQLETLLEQALASLAEAHTVAQLEQLRVQYLGKKGAISDVSRGLKQLPASDRPALGAVVNRITGTLNERLEAALEAAHAAELTEKLATQRLDVTLPGRCLAPRGGAHPLSRVMARVEDIFMGLGFTVLDTAEGLADGLPVNPEVETEFYNFDALNFPPDHPARDTQDTFYTDVAPHVVLRSQTSNVQIRWMARHSPPIRLVAGGRVYRNEEINRRKHVSFHQLEGLVVDQGIHLSDLKGTLEAFVAAFFGPSIPVRFRSSYFPFTEPSLEVDIQCLFCQGAGCATCGQHGWLEILGAGMVDPNVLQAVGIDPEKYTGFAFGMGIERLAMLLYGIDDIRIFTLNDLRVFSQMFDAPSG